MTVSVAIVQVDFDMRTLNFYIMTCLICIGLPGDSTACVPTRAISAIELVAQADSIILAKAVDFGSTADLEQSPNFPEWAASRRPITFQVGTVLKGDFGNSSLHLPGSLNDFKGGNDGDPPYELVRKGGQLGSCYAFDYKRGAWFLLFIRENSPYWAPLAPVNELVSGPNDPWVWWVRGAIEGLKHGGAAEFQ